MRERLLRHGETVSAALQALLANGYKIIGEDYKKDHFPDVESSIKMILNKKSFYIGKKVDINASVYTKEFAGEIAECFRQMSDIFCLLADE